MNLVLSLVASRELPRPPDAPVKEPEVACDARLIVSADVGNRPLISKHLFGLMLEHLGRCVYGGVCDEASLARSEVVSALRELQTPNLRWPGGCFADGYHWQDGVGPREARPRRVNQHWGGGIEGNSFGTNEFLELCEQIGCEPYIVGNVGSGTVRELRDWHEYTTYPSGSSLADLRCAHGRAEPWAVRLWGIGNEPWGSWGGDMDVHTYASEYKRYACFLASAPGVPPLTRVASGANGRDDAWTDGMMSMCKKPAAGGRVRFAMEALSVHLYCSVRREGITGREATSAAQEAAYFTLLQKADGFRQALRAHLTVMDRHDPERLVALYVDEWGVWYAEPPRPVAGAPVEPPQPPCTSALLEQACTLKDALVAALCLHAMIDSCERVQLANLAQAVNVLHAPLRTANGELVRTPTFHALSLLNRHMACTRLDVQQPHALYFNHGTSAVPRLSYAVSMESTGTRDATTIHVSVVHVHPHAAVSLDFELRGFGTSPKLQQKRSMVLAGRMDAIDCVPVELGAEGANMSESGTHLRLALPPASLVVVTLTLSRG